MAQITEIKYIFPPTYEDFITDLKLKNPVLNSLVLFSSNYDILIIPYEENDLITLRLYSFINSEFKEINSINYPFIIAFTPADMIFKLITLDIPTNSIINDFRQDSSLCFSYELFTLTKRNCFNVLFNNIFTLKDLMTLNTDSMDKLAELMVLNTKSVDNCTESNTAFSSLLSNIYQLLFKDDKIKKISDNVEYLKNIKVLEDLDK